MTTHSDIPFRDIPSSEWEEWKHFYPTWNARDRSPCMQMMLIERSALRIVGNKESINVPHKILGLTINISRGGFCFLANAPLDPGDIFRVYLPVSTAGTIIPTLADVRWVRPLPFEKSGLHLIGLKFVL